MGRMSPLHSPSDGFTANNRAASVPSASRNGGADNADVNGTTLDLRGRRGAMFILNQGVTTGSAATAARIQYNDLPGDETNGNWTNVNYTTYANARITNQTTDNQQYLMDVMVDALPYASVRAVLTPEANVAIAGIGHVIF